LVLVSQKVGFFGSGNTTANITAVIRNKADLRGAQIDLVAPSRRGWGLDTAMDPATLTKAWGTPPDAPNEPSPHGGEGREA
jgi:hypothetical protein